jgi:hypothetical protein
MIERKDRSSIFGFCSEEDVGKFIESDFRIRNGLCPNGHGLMEGTDFGQQCPTCSFFCNTKAEKDSVQ